MHWTSLEAYATIFDDLPRRRQEVLTHLLRYVLENDQFPTSQELETFIWSGGYKAASNTPGCAKRLQELADNHNAIHRHGIKQCSQTGHSAISWAPGPRPHTKLGDPPTNTRLVSRLRVLRENWKKPLDRDTAAWLLNATRRMLDTSWDQATPQPEEYEVPELS
jgi:hypothetical protein